jgi:hypothetical protein
MDRALLSVAGIGDHDVGFTAIVAGGQYARARIPPVAQRLGHLRQRVAGAQHLAAHKMGGQVAVAEAEPVGLYAVGREFLLGMPGFVAVAPAPFRVDSTAEGVHAGVEVRADPYTEHPRVVADIDDGRQLMLGIVAVWRGRGAKLPKPQEVLHAQQEAGAAHSADQNRDLHIDRE